MAYLSTDLLKPLLKKLLALWKARDQEIINIADTFGDPVQLAKYYVQPECQHHNPADIDEDDVRSHVRSPAFKTLNDFMDKEVLVRDGKSQLFILSDAGMGKTSLLMMLKLSHLSAFWPQGHECVLLKLGQNTLDIVEEIENQRNTVLLLDALDEDPTAWDRLEGRLLELLEKTKFFRRVIISCRTQFFPEKGLDPFGGAGRVVLGGFRCPVLFLSLFDDERVEAYLHKRFSVSWYRFLSRKAEQKRQKAVSILKKTGSLRFRPLLLAHIEELVEAPQQEWDAYRIYVALVEVWLLREQRKIREVYKDAHKLPGMEDLLKACIKVAEFMQQKEKRSIAEPALQALISVNDNITYLRNFDIGGRSLLNRNSERAYRFSHYTIQEFLLAHGIAEKHLTDGPLIRATDQIVRFLDLSSYESFSRLSLKDFKLGEYFKKYPRIGRKNLRGVSLTGVDLSNAYLENADLSGADLSEADLSGANLNGADLSGANLNNACLAGVFIWDKLQGGDQGPEMVLIPGGTFRMGEIQDAGDDEKIVPVHEISVSMFAIGRYPVTFNEYDRFAEAAGREKPNDEGWGRGRHPVINVSWEDAAAYCEWLSEQTGHEYRLPTEAEWEYAARAGTETDYCFGNDEQELKKYAWYFDNSGGRTHSVGEKKANAWGLYDVHGNVWEWAGDRFDSDYYANSSPPDPAGSPNDRVLRGGSWNGSGHYVRSAVRNRGSSGDRLKLTGFRLARTQ
ncbi:MAG: SUMF1/EgtB/PvdO family nonheme iron enzyme [Gammaproteobacteria bacterium]|nr:SUMF1/EgtB/PvdO family nonheme iron enzyme [Gammaproteobacteria bacterium]